MSAIQSSASIWAGHYNAYDGEQLLGMFLDDHGRFIACECLAMGTTDNVALAGRPLIARVLDLGARGPILAYNHPSGDVTRSPSARATTQRLQGLLISLDCKLKDHLIVSYDRSYSMAWAGELWRIRRSRSTSSGATF